jgi:hypothetical protein
MAGITVFVIYGVTDLTLQVISVLLMLRVIVCQDILMAVHTFYGYGTVPATKNLSCAVEFLSVAFGACHRCLCPVDIGYHPFVIPEVLVTDTRPMTGCAVVLH